MRIAIDIDDTITQVDRITATERYLNERGLKYNLINPDAQALRLMYDWPRGEFTKFMQNGGDKLFLTAPIRKGVRETIEKWRAAGHEIVFLTARIAEWFGDSEEASRRQLDENQIPYDEVVSDVCEKGEYCLEHGIGVLIDNNFEICKKAQELGVKAVMFVDEHNLARAKEIRYAGSNWEHIASAVEFILNPPRSRD